MHQMHGAHALRRYLTEPTRQERPRASQRFRGAGTDYCAVTDHCAGTDKRQGAGISGASPGRGLYAGAKITSFPCGCEYCVCLQQRIVTLDS